MKRILMIALLLTWVSAGNANDETTVELPGGATMDFVWIEPGTFMMGSPESEPWRYDGEGPRHPVTISRGFYLGKYKLTQGQWESVIGTPPRSGENKGQEYPNHPVVYISWEDVQAFIQKLNEVAEEETYRLPTEAEWEYACRAGTTTRFSFGKDESRLGDYAWYSGNSSPYGMKDVGTKLSNAWGLHDMHGNVYEWCQDWYGNYSSGAQIDPTGPASGHYRVKRGGSFIYSARGARSAYRSSASPGFRSSFAGVRLLRIR